MRCIDAINREMELGANTKLLVGFKMVTTFEGSKVFGFDLKFSLAKKFFFQNSKKSPKTHILFVTIFFLKKNEWADFVSR